MSEVLPYKAEYAKSGRASCRACKSSIEQSSLRIAAMIQSPMYDGRMAQWYHYMCFFGKQKPKSAGDIENFSALRWEDQEKINKKIESLAAASSSGNGVEAASTTKKGAKRAKPAAAKPKGAMKEFLVEYAKSNRSTCRGCEEKIIKDEVRMSKKDFESDEGRRYGGLDRWHHMECFAKLRAELCFYESGEVLPGFLGLKPEDKATIKNLLPKIDVKEEAPDAVDGETPAKKVKVEEKKDDKLDQEIKKQTKKMYKIRDLVEKLSSGKGQRQFLIDLLESNDEQLESLKGISEMLDRIADIMMFGVTEPCERCNGMLVYASNVGYRCCGNSGEWVKCENVVVTPKRKTYKLPKEYAENYPELKALKFSVTDRIIRTIAPSAVATKLKDEIDGPKVKSGRSYPLNGMEFYIYKLSKDKKVIKNTIDRYGGKLVPKVHKHLTAVISTKDGLEKMDDEMTSTLEQHGIQVIPKDFLDKCTSGDPCELIAEMSLCNWGKNPMKRVEKTLAQNEASKSMKSGKSKFTKSGSSKVTMKVQAGSAVDPDCGLQDEAHVYREGADIYSVVLGIVDIQADKNSYYKLQILQSNTFSSKFWMYRAWGRVGTTIGGTKLENFKSCQAALKEFKFHFQNKTGNDWETRHDFEKVPGKMYVLDMDYGDKKPDVKMEALNATNSKLSKPVQELLMKLFDIDLMKKTMLEFELDLEKMPLGKISKAQIYKAYTVLSELQGLLEKADGDIKISQRPLLLEAANRFYTLVPHDFGLNTPPLLDSVDIIKNKMEMLDSLLEMEVAFSFLSTGQESGEHTLDEHYKRLNTDIEVLERECKEFEIIHQYITNTHAATHQQYKLEIVDVFKVCRKEEEKRYKPFRKLPNRKLLWHGSRLTNFAGILSQGLRIAPPEAPTTGYMFGKGIYFADMVSKSANYCLTSPGNNVGLMLLCDVALGNMYQRKQADYIEKLPNGHHSCKGVGSTGPDPSGSIHLEDGLEVPAGKPVRATDGATSLLYNEYIVYDVAQVKAKYLLKLNFKYNY